VDERIGQLIIFKEQNKHCNVPIRSPEHPTLGKWVGHQREYYIKGMLSADRIARLESLGFIWERWEEMYAALVEYKQQNGHCKVPYDWLENPKLGKWVSRQRKNYKKGKLSSDRIARLESLGFEWSRKAK